MNHPAAQHAPTPTPLAAASGVQAPSPSTAIPLSTFLAASRVCRPTRHRRAMASTSRSLWACLSLLALRCSSPALRSTTASRRPSYRASCRSCRITSSVHVLSFLTSTRARCHHPSVAPQAPPLRRQRRRQHPPRPGVRSLRCPRHAGTGRRTRRDSASKTPLMSSSQATSSPTRAPSSESSRRRTKSGCAARRRARLRLSSI